MNFIQKKQWANADEGVIQRGPCTT